MKAKSLWRPTKFVATDRGLKASRDPQEVAVGSRLICDLQAEVYERLIREHARGVLLDLGCGKVPLYGVYGDLVDNTVCIDWASTKHLSPHLDYEFDLNEGVPLTDNEFDTVLLTDVLEHVTEPDRLFREIVRVLRPGGKLLLTTPFLYWIHEAPHDYCRYTSFRLKKFCDACGLVVVSLECYGGAPEVILDILSKQFDHYKLLSFFHLAFAQRFLRSRLGSHLSVRSRRSFPLGYALAAVKP